jgi:hypothetical protein
VTLERHFQEQVIDLARLYGWRVAHFRPAQTAKGWRTPVSADGKGFPDLVLVRDRVIFAELKGELGRLTSDQRNWVGNLDRAGAEVHVWRPIDLEEIECTLRPLRRSGRS